MKIHTNSEDPVLLDLHRLNRYEWGMADRPLDFGQVARIGWCACLAVADGDDESVEALVDDLLSLGGGGTALIAAAVGWASLIVAAEERDIGNVMLGDPDSGRERIWHDGRQVVAGDFDDAVTEVVATVLCAVANRDERGATHLLMRTANPVTYLTCRFLLGTAGSILRAV